MADSMTTLLERAGASVNTNTVVETLTLDDGTTIGVRKAGGAAYLRAVELGNGNQAATVLIEAIMCVVKINEEVQVTPTTRSKVDALCERLGRDGVEAIQIWYQTE